ncbi:hypothetical protein T439DRAFT_70795 [Meredithblackwellia eburnea MCA 4105]
MELDQDEEEDDGAPLSLSFVDDPDQKVPPSSDLIINILKAFQHNLPEPPDSHQRKDWFGWLFRFVRIKLLGPEALPSYGLKWPDNLMRREGVKAQMEEDKEWWLLSWENKAHLLRVLVDFQLTYSKPVREKLELCYDMGKQRVLKRQPELNPLIVDPVGQIRKTTIWQIDNSPRLYVSSNHYKPTATLETLTTDIESYKAFAATLASEEEYLARVAEAQKKAEEEAEREKATKKKRKKKKKEGEDPNAPEPPPRPPKKIKVDVPLSENEKNEIAVRKKLDERLPLVLQHEEVCNFRFLKRGRDDGLRFSRSNNAGADCRGSSSTEGDRTSGRQGCSIGATAGQDRLLWNQHSRKTTSDTDSSS